MEHNVDMNARDIEGWTPLHAAAATGNIQMINLLVTEGASLVALNNDDKMPIDVAADSDIKYILQQKMIEAGKGSTSSQSEVQDIIWSQKLTFTYVARISLVLVVVVVVVVVFVVFMFFSMLGEKHRKELLANHSFIVINTHKFQLNFLSVQEQVLYTD